MRYKERLYILIALLIFALKIDSQIIKVDIDPLDQPKGTLTLSDLVEQVEYIPLETNGNCSVGKIASYDVSENYIVVLNSQANKVFLFNKNGRFVTQIGRQEQDGSDFFSPKCVYLDELKNCVYVHDNHKLLMYDFSGKLLNSFSFDFCNNYSIYAYNDNRFVSGILNDLCKEEDSVYGIWDSTMNLEKKGVKAVSVELKGRVSVVWPLISCYIYHGYPHLKESLLNDTIYLLDKNNEFNPQYIINCGKYGMTAEVKGDADHFFENLRSGKYIGGMTFLETPHFLLSKYEYMAKWLPCYFDKKLKKLLYFDSTGGIPDDYAGGIDFWPDKQKNNEWYCFINASDFLEKYSKQNKLTLKGSAASIQKVQSLLTMLSKDDNPVLIIAKIKE